MSDPQTIRIGNRDCLVRFCTPEEALRPPEGRRPLYITDTNVAPLLAAHWPEGVATDVDQLVAYPAGEAAKDWPQIETTLLRGFELGLARDDWMIGVGGGVVTDMASFAASIYMRGCRLLLVPTSLLAMVDAALGGKTGINFGGLKNMVGTFYPAQELRIAPAFVQTLSELEFKSGLGEVIKHALLDNADHWKLLHDQRAAILRRDPAIMEGLVRDSLAVKMRVVQADPEEHGIRAHLNLGHTFGHALEAVAGFGEWTHGEAIMWGLVRALALSARLGLCDPAYAKEVRTLVEAYGYRTTTTADPEALLAAMKHDKKKKGGVVRFVLQSGLCQTLTQAVPDDAVRAVLEDQA